MERSGARPVSKLTDAEMMAAYPFVPWREPIRLHTAEQTTHFACRLCIALVGFKQEDLAKHPKTREEFDEHMRKDHAT